MGGPFGITWLAWLVLAPISIFFTIEVVPEGYAPGYSQLTGYWIGLLGHVVTGAVLLIGKLTLFRNVDSKPRPILMLVWFASAGLARGAAVAWMFGEWGITETPDYFERMRSGAVLVLVWFAVSAVMVDGYYSYKNSFFELTEKLEHQKALRDRGATELKQRIDGLVEQIRVTLADALRVGSSSRDIHQAVDELVRPLAHGLEQKSKVLAQSAGRVRRRIKPGPIVRTALYETPYNPGWTALMAVVGSISSRLWQAGWLGILDSAVNALVIWAVFSIAKKLRLVGPVVPVVWFITGLASSFMGQLVSIGTPTFSSSLVYLSVNVFAPALIVALIGAFDRNANANLDALRKVLSELEWETAALEQRVWVEQRRLARFVHSELQSRLRAFALRMDLAERMPTADEISELRMQCQSALLVGSEQREFLLFQSDIQELWGGLIDIRFHANSTSMAALQDDPYATAAAIEICREGIGNAAKHSKAKVIDINIQSSGGRNGQLDIEIVNDGSSAIGGEQGFGLRTIAELASDWSLSKRGSETVLHAKIPIQLAAQIS
jgi:signal transduction histidine kinase